jgi:hypothetical protein
MCSKTFHLTFLNSQLIPWKCPRCGLDLYSLSVLLSDNKGIPLEHKGNT